MHLNRRGRQCIGSHCRRKSQGHKISDAVSSSMLVCMQKFLQAQAEQQEQERKRRIAQDNILQNIKQEEGGADTPLPCPSPLGELLVFNTPQQRQRRGSVESLIAYGDSIHPPRMETEAVMGSLRPFSSHIPPNLQLNSLPELHTTSGATSLPPRPQSPSVRSRTSEQLSAIQSLSDWVQGAKLVPDRSEQGSVISKPVQTRLVKKKIKDYLNQLAES